MGSILALLQCVKYNSSLNSFSHPNDSDLLDTIVS